MEFKSAADVARQYRIKNPDMPTLKLARILYNEQSRLFNGVEHARTILRSIEGKTGDKNRKGFANRSLYKDEHRPFNPYKLPDSEETVFEPFVLKGHKRILVLNDIHIPYHSVEAVTAVITFCKRKKIDAIVLNGDIIDAHQLSRFEKDPRKKDFAQELGILAEFIRVLKRVFKCRIYYKLGNHEERYEHYLFMKAGELVGVEEFEIENILRRRVGDDVDIIKGKRIIKANALNIIHGHEFGSGFFSPVNVARGLALRAKTSAMQGHNHQVSENTEVNLNEEIQTTWSIGCLCELHPKYLPINKWAHGFAIVELDEDGKSFHVRNFRIYKGKVL